MQRNQKHIITVLAVWLMIFSCVFPYRNTVGTNSSSFAQGLSVATYAREQTETQAVWETENKACLLEIPVSEESLGIVRNTVQIIRGLPGGKKQSAGSRMVSSVVVIISLMALLFLAEAFIDFFDRRCISLWKVIQYIHRIDGKKKTTMFAH